MIHAYIISNCSLDYCTNIQITFTTCKNKYNGINSNIWYHVHIYFQVTIKQTTKLNIDSTLSSNTLVFFRRGKLLTFSCQVVFISEEVLCDPMEFLSWLCKGNERTEITCLNKEMIYISLTCITYASPSFQTLVFLLIGKGITYKGNMTISMGNCLIAKRTLENRLHCSGGRHGRPANRSSSVLPCYRSCFFFPISEWSKQLDCLGGDKISNYW